MLNLPCLVGGGVVGRGWQTNTKTEKGKMSKMIICKVEKSDKIYSYAQ